LRWKFWKGGVNRVFAQKNRNGAGMKSGRIEDTYEGRFAASRASLSLLLAFPVDDSRRWCFPPFPMLELGGDARVAFKLPGAPSEDPFPPGCEWLVIGIGAALAAMADRESKLDAASDCCWTNQK
jgi:hypothetical protein